MRTNIVLDDELVAQAMELTGANTKREVIDRALRTLIRLERQRAVLGLRGSVSWEGDLNSMRQARFMPDEGGDFGNADPG